MEALNHPRTARRAWRRRHRGRRCAHGSSPCAMLRFATSEAWRDLAARSIEPNPFYEPDFLLSASRHLRNGNYVALLVAEDCGRQGRAGRFHACLPLRLPGISRAPLVTSWRHLYDYLGTSLVAPSGPVQALICLLSALTGNRQWPRAAVLELFGNDGPIAVYLRQAADHLGLTLQAHAPGVRVWVGAGGIGDEIA